MLTIKIEYNDGEFTVNRDLEISRDDIAYLREDTLRHVVGDAISNVLNTVHGKRVDKAQREMQDLQMRAMQMGSGQLRGGY